MSDYLSVFLPQLPELCQSAELQPHSIPAKTHKTDHVQVDHREQYHTQSLPFFNLFNRYGNNIPSYKIPPLL